LLAVIVNEVLVPAQIDALDGCPVIEGGKGVACTFVIAESRNKKRIIV
jgi:hypothetical protein